MLDETKLYTLSEAHSLLAKAYNGACWSYLSKEERSADDNAKMINLAHASLQHWSESKECRPVNLQRGEWLISWAYAFAGRIEPAYHHANRCFDLTFKERESMQELDIVYAYMAMARVLALVGSNDEARNYLSQLFELASALQNINKVDKKILIDDLGSGRWNDVADSVQQYVKSLLQL